MENFTQELTRSDYFQYIDGIGFEYQCLLAASNGMIYNPEGEYGIVKNVTAHHLAASWREGEIDFYEEGVKYNSQREYFLVKGTLAEVLRFSNQVNTFEAITLEAIA